jgi:hypothetical protein
MLGTNGLLTSLEPSSRQLSWIITDRRLGIQRPSKLIARFWASVRKTFPSELLASEKS